MNQPMLSVCVITYKHEKYIRQCLEGIMMQKTSFDFEVIIGEDCSPDNTRSIIREFEQKYPSVIKPIYHEKNVGAQRNAYEFCIPKLTGKYVAICEGDDYWTDPLKLQKQVDFLEKHKEIALCYHRINIIDTDGSYLQKKEPDESMVYYSWREIFHIKIPTLSVVYRNSLKIDFKEMLKVKSGDYYLFGLLSGYGGAAELGFVGAVYRKHPGGVYTGLSTIDQYKQSIVTLKLMKESPSFNKEQQKEIQKEIRIRKRRYIRQFMRRKEVVNIFMILFT